MSVASCWLIARPMPEPPWRRVWTCSWSKGRKQVLALGRDAGPRVDDAHAQLDPVLGTRGLGGDDDLDPAVLRELDGVAHEVHEHLTHARSVADEAIGERVLHQRDELDPALVGAREQEVDDALDAAAQAELVLLQREAPGLDRGEVEDVVEDRQEALGGAMDRAPVVALVRRQVGLEQELRHPDDPVHRGADLVAHAREELALCAGWRARPQCTRPRGARSWSAIRRRRPRRSLDREQAPHPCAAGAARGGRRRADPSNRRT
jgi:hypothetical protein